MQRGKFIVIEGLDGSGKGVQTNLLIERLRKEGYQVEMADFPQYGNWSAAFVERYLRGEFGSGKTQIGHILAVNALKEDPDVCVVYLDTENTFRPERITQLAQGVGKFTYKWY